MIFTKTGAEQVMIGTKTVTRRLIPAAYRHPDPPYITGRDYAVQPGRGAPAAARMLVKDVRRERLSDALNEREALMEGYPSMRRFVIDWARIHDRCFDPDAWVWRIEFELIA